MPTFLSDLFSVTGPVSILPGKRTRLSAVAGYWKRPDNTDNAGDAGI